MLMRSAKLWRMRISFCVNAWVSRESAYRYPSVRSSADICKQTPERNGYSNRISPASSGSRSPSAMSIGFPVDSVFAMAPVPSDRRKSFTYRWDKLWFVEICKYSVSGLIMITAQVWQPYIRTIRSTISESTRSGSCVEWRILRTSEKKCKHSSGFKGDIRHLLAGCEWYHLNCTIYSDHFIAHDESLDDDQSPNKRILVWFLMCFLLYTW